MESTQNNIKKSTLPVFVSKVIHDKEDIKEALERKKPLNELSKEKGIKFAKPL